MLCKEISQTTVIQRVFHLSWMLSMLFFTQRSITLPCISSEMWNCEVGTHRYLPMLVQSEFIGSEFNFWYRHVWEFSTFDSRRCSCSLLSQEYSIKECLKLYVWLWSLSFVQHKLIGSQAALTLYSGWIIGSTKQHKFITLQSFGVSTALANCSINYKLFSAANQMIHRISIMC